MHEFLSLTTHKTKHFQLELQDTTCHKARNAIELCPARSEKTFRAEDWYHALQTIFTGKWIITLDLSERRAKAIAIPFLAVIPPLEGHVAIHCGPATCQ
jgi:hypothetical protein